MKNPPDDIDKTGLNSGNHNYYDDKYMPDFKITKEDWKYIGIMFLFCVLFLIIIFKLLSIWVHHAI